MNRNPRYLVRAVGLRTVREGNHALQMAEAPFGAFTRGPIRFPPVFIIGAPRSGTTLLFQVLIAAFRFGYLSNLHCLVHGFPAIVQLGLGLARKQEPEVRFTSKRGSTSGLLQPSECGAFWYRFFSRAMTHIGPEDVSRPAMGRVRRSYMLLAWAAGRPILFKNLYCGTRLLALNKAFPESVFIVMHRDEIDTGHSLLAGRKEVHGSYTEFWGLRPPHPHRLAGLPPEEQVVEQIRDIYETIERDAREVGTDRFLEVGYEELCASPTTVVNQVGGFLTDRSIHLEPTGLIPGPFAESTRIRIDADLYARLRAYSLRTRPTD